jgi:multicomponent Na+:H+ antiporter subunit D
MIEQHLPLLVPFTYLFSALMIPLVGIGGRRYAYPVALIASLLATLVSVHGLTVVLREGAMRYAFGGWAPPIGIEFVLDPLSSFLSVLLTCVTSLVLIHARRSVESDVGEKEIPFYSVTMLLMTGLTGIVLTGDLFNLFVFLEISSLAGYAIIAVGEKPAPVAAFRYLILGTIGATMYLIGLAFLYMLTGSLNMADLASIIPQLPLTPPLVVSFSMMVVGVALKMALFPMHGWLPDAYTYAPSTASALLAPIGTKVAAYVLLRLMFFVFQPSFGRDMLPVGDVLTYLAAGGILFGSIFAIAQKELKRMLAFSSVSQIGYIALGIGLGSQLALTGAVLHIVNHAFMKAALFLVAGNTRLVVGHSRIDQFDGSLRRFMPWSMAAFTVAALSMIGIPPLAGFFSKWYLVLAGIEQSAWWIVVVILLSSLLSAVYFFRVLERIYLREPSTAGAVEYEALDRKEVRMSMLVPTLTLSGALFILGLFNSIIVTKVIHSMLPLGL